MPRSMVSVVCVLLVAVGGCKGKEARDEAAIASDLKKKGTAELLEETAEDEYNPPADGRLTEAQVQMYLKVREQEQKIAEVARKEMKQHAETAEKKGDKSLTGMAEAFRALGSAADVLTADIRAAKELGYNTAEYTWVKGQVLEASGAQMTKNMQQATAALMDETYQQTKKQYDEAKDEAVKKMLAEMLASYEQSKKEAETSSLDPAVQHNLQLLSKYEDALKAISMELSKWQEKDVKAGEAEPKRQ
jgi:hypothetical protein